MLPYNNTIKLRSVTCTLITFRDARQEECYEKAAKKDSFLISATCRFGKTYVGSKLFYEAWSADIVVILSGKDVRGEWKDGLKQAGFKNIITTNEDLNKLDFDNFDYSQRYAFFISAQKAGYGLTKRDSTVVTSDQRLIDVFNKFPGTRVLCFDESHFAEQTERSQKIISMYHCDKKLYISGTAYTSSLVKQFSQEDRYDYTYMDLVRDYKAGILSYTPVLLRMYILDTFTSLSNESCVENWSELFRNKEDTKCLLERTIKFVKEHDDQNSLIVCNRTKDAETVVRILNSSEFKEYNVRALSAAGDNGEIDSATATRFYENNSTTTNFIVTCDRLCTGSSIGPLQSVLFYCPTQSAIKFMQTAMRCCTPWKGHNKEFGDVVCFNKFGAFSIYNTTASLLLQEKLTTRIRQDDYEEFQEALPMFIEDNVGLRQVEFAEATNFEALYVHGRTKFFTDFSDMSEFDFFSFNKASIRDLAIQIAKVTGQKLEEVEHKLNSAHNQGGLEGLNTAYNELLHQSENVKSIAQIEIDNVEKARASLQKAFTCVVENCILNHIISTNYEINYNLAENIILDVGFCSVDKFKELVDMHPEYVRCIVNYCNVQLTNLRSTDYEL